MKLADPIGEYDIRVRDLELLTLEGKLRDASRQLARAFDRNEKLVNALDEARQRVAEAREGHTRYRLANADVAKHAPFGAITEELYDLIFRLGFARPQLLVAQVQLVGPRFTSRFTAHRP